MTLLDLPVQCTVRIWGTDDVTVRARNKQMAQTDCCAPGMVTPDTDRCNCIPVVKYWRCKGKTSGEFYSRID